MTPHLGRTHAPGLMSTIGMFVNTLPLRLSVEKALQFGELLDHVAATVKAAVANSHVRRAVKDFEHPGAGTGWCISWHAS